MELKIPYKLNIIFPMCELGAKGRIERGEIWRTKSHLVWKYDHKRSDTSDVVSLH